MIISASRRTDIPAFYGKWFMNRLRDGYVLVRNPMNIHQVSRVRLTRDVVDFIVFWTKNPANMLQYIDEIDKYQYNYYFQFTLNPYDQEIEANIPKKMEVIDTFKKLSDRIGRKKVIWRYDPILISDKITIEYHYKYFEVLACILKDYTDKCIISFVDFYYKTERNIKHLNVTKINDCEKREIASQLSKIAKKFNLKMETCAEDLDLSDIGIEHARCIDGKLIEDILGEKLDVCKDQVQRPECGCIASVDIGTYNTCNNGCTYCYANYSKDVVMKNVRQHNPKSPLLFGELTEQDRIIDRKMESHIILQKSLFG